MATEKETQSKKPKRDLLEDALMKFFLATASNAEEMTQDYLSLQKEKIKTEQLKQELLKMALDPEQSQNLKRQGIIIQL
jgi:hypothetical protein